MKIKGYTLHGDYYLADNVIPNKTWKEACEMKEEITLSNGKKVVAHTLSKKELETIPTSERIGYLNNENKGWYWTSTPTGDSAWLVGSSGDFGRTYLDISGSNGGIRLGFHKNKIRQFLDVE